MDSNSRYIDFRKLWTLKTTDIQKKGTLKEVNKILDTKVYTNLRYFFFSVGCNDVEYKSGVDVFIDIKKTAERIQSMYPDVKVIVSEVTPRMDSEDLDKEVKECNELLNDFVKQSENTFIVRNSNLRDRKFFLDDGKHLKQNTIARFASNIKWALRRAYGIKWTNYTTNTTDRRYNNQYYNYERNSDLSGTSNLHGYGTDRPKKMWGQVPMPSSDHLIQLLQTLVGK